MEQVPGSPQGPQDAQGPPRCYRHPDRETGIRCARCDKPICPDCMVSASVGFQCPDCVRGGSGTGHGPAASRPRTITGGTIAADPRLVTKILIGINVAVFIAVHVWDRLLSDFVLIGAWPPAPYVPDQGVAGGEWYRLVTSMFTHQEVWHIAFNMLGLWWLGGPLEAALGRARYIALYMVSGLAGSALTYAIAGPSEQSLGASGAVFGLLGATAVLVRRLNYDMRPVIGLLALNLLFTFTWGNIAWQAHVGGLVAGVVVGYAMVHAPRERRSLVQYGTCALVLAVVVVTVLVRTSQLT
ncbi:MULTISPECIES: rhomboid family intramembrane serine protease [unclassified Streptomyces]|uniref:Rhomboid family intramembrane serine protease n=1 Tax=Streptomyces sp. NBC_00119 TaxID=2975659 RepID=A0AAU1U9E9_9ACTN|nr:MULTISPECIES: rhomboid family intramembrane serine protease [unclassified Streptomyces]MCX4644350.1 rhomboid family intramembrane serine protease [Streptomyces sp. NBC_01446]MCX5325462.1 rhomboid family intramembrane serine protease [Streptomyces sp. NBC_00120]